MQTAVNVYKFKIAYFIIMIKYARGPESTFPGPCLIISPSHVSRVKINSPNHYSVPGKKSNIIITSTVAKIALFYFAVSKLDWHCI